MEVWKPVPFLDGFEASSEGRIRRGIKIATQYDYPGRAYKTFNGGKRSLTVSVHRAVCAAFHGMPVNEKDQAAHLDGNSKNNKPDNLKWKTCKDNHADKKIHGTDGAGEKNSRAKITKEKVIQIFELYAKGATCPLLADIFGVEKQAIHKILTRQRWAHIPIPYSLIAKCQENATNNIKSAYKFKAQ